MEVPTSNFVNISQDCTSELPLRLREVPLGNLHDTVIIPHTTSLQLPPDSPVVLYLPRTHFPDMTVSLIFRTRIIAILLGIALCPLLAGCGKTVRRLGTEQLLASDAIDRVIAQINFSPLAGQKVYFDHQYIKNIKGIGFVNGDYIISSLRQQLIAANCLLQDNKNDADYIVEARVGALGTDQHEISYGVPANNLLNTASTFVPSAPVIPTIPEISIAKKNNEIGAAKIGVFAYHRETKQPVWQAGVTTDRSRSKESWFMGAGPFQSGTIYDGPMFAGSKIRRPIRNLLFRRKNRGNAPELPPINYTNPHMFPLAQQLIQDKTSDLPPLMQPERQLADQKKEEAGPGKVIPASAEEPAKEK